MSLSPGSYFRCAKFVANDVLKTLSGSAAKVYLSLCNRADGDDGTCFPTHGTIASDCGFSERTVRYAIDELAAAGAIEVKNRGRTSNLYRIVYPATSCQLEDYQTGNPLPDKQDLTGNQLPVEEVLTGNGWPDKSLTGNLAHFNRQQVADKQTSLTNIDEEAAVGDKQLEAKRIAEIHSGLISFLGVPRTDRWVLDIAYALSVDDDLRESLEAIADEIERSPAVNSRIAVFRSRVDRDFKERINAHLAGLPLVWRTRVYPND